MPIVQRYKPVGGRTADNAGVGIGNRGGAFGEQYVVNEFGYYAAEGSYWTAMNPTLSTGIANSAATGFVATTPCVSVFNNNTALPNTEIQIDYIRMQCTAVGASGTSVAFVLQTDTGNRFSSGGTTLTAVTANRNLAPTTNATINVGALTATAASSSRNLSHGTVRTVIVVAGDTFLFDCSGQARGLGGSALNGTVPTLFQIPCAQCIIGPQMTALLNVWMPAGAASSFEYEIAYVER